MAEQREFYTTRQGETWDQIALEVYGDESYADVVMQSNLDLLDIMVFSAGELVYTPELAEEAGEDDPPWVDDDTDEEDEDPYA